MNAPTSAPVDWRSLYNFSSNGVQMPISPQTNDYWNLNVGNGSKEAIATNAMPYVMNPALLFANGQTPDAAASNKANLYSAPTQTSGQGMARGATDPMTQILGLIQQNPDIVPLLLQNLQGQQGG